MNFLKTLWSWLLKLMRCSPRMPVSISDLEREPLAADCCPEDCCEETECGPDDECCDEGECAPEDECCEEEEEVTPAIVEEEPVEEVVEAPVVSAPVGELLREILLSEGISDTVVEKYEIVKTFEGWYDGPLNPESVRESIKEFKTSQGGVIKAKLSRIQ